MAINSAKAALTSTTREHYNISIICNNWEDFQHSRQDTGIQIYPENLSIPEYSLVTTISQSLFMFYFCFNLSIYRVAQNKPDYLLLLMLKKNTSS